MISSTPTASVIARNYSIAASTKDGKYNISGQPVKI